MAVTIPEKEVAALLCGRLFETADEQVVTAHGLGIEPYAHPSAGNLAESTVAAAPGVSLTADVGPRTVARVDVMDALQLAEHVAIYPSASLCRRTGLRPSSGSNPSQSRSSRMAVSYSGRLRMRS